MRIVGEAPGRRAQSSQRHYATDVLMVGTLGKVALTKPEQIHDYFEAAMKVFDRPRIVALDGSEAFAADDITVVIAGLDTLMTTYIRAAHVFPMNCSRSLKNRDSKRGIR